MKLKIFQLSFTFLLILRVPKQQIYAEGFSFTTPPPFTGSLPPENTNPFVQSLPSRIFKGKRVLHVRALTKLPDFKGKGSKIVGMTSLGDSLYVTTSTSGAAIYKVHLPSGNVSLWFNLGHQVPIETNGKREVDCDSTQHGGLRSVAFPPDFWKTGLFYTSYVETRPKFPRKFRYLSTPDETSNPDSVVVEWRYRFRTSSVVKGSYRVLMRIGMPVFDHPIKQMAFQGRFLLIAHGDGSVQSAIGGGGMRNDGLGKILRIDPRKQPSGKPYGIPKYNPFVGKPGFKDEIYALGFRNPHNICVSKRHGIFVTDAGRDNVEEVNIIQPGGNYGWPKREGSFVHLERGGTLIGIAKLPVNDAKFRYLYPNVQIGHWARLGGALFGQALAGSCPVENNSPMGGTFIYANFPADGQMYYSWTGDMKRAVVMGPPNKLRSADVYKTSLIFHRSGRKPVKVNNFLGVVQNDGYPGASRADIRFGRGNRGEIYVSSKTSGTIYIIESTVPGSKK